MESVLQLRLLCLVMLGVSLCLPAWADMRGNRGGNTADRLNASELELVRARRPWVPTRPKPEPRPIVRRTVPLHVVRTPAPSEPVEVAMAPLGMERLRTPQPRLTPSVVHCMANNIYFEARGEGAAGMVAVSAVTLNRAKDGRTVCEVVHDGCQFSWTCSPHGQPHGEAWEKAKAVARSVLNARIAVDPTGGATYFNRCGGAPDNSAVMTTKIGHHCFYGRKLEASRATLKRLSNGIALAESDGAPGYHVLVHGVPLAHLRHASEARGSGLAGLGG